MEYETNENKPKHKQINMATASQNGFFLFRYIVG